jgi:hypothetical protein
VIFSWSLSVILTLPPLGTLSVGGFFAICFFPPCELFRLR